MNVREHEVSPQRGERTRVRAGRGLSAVADTTSWFGFTSLSGVKFVRPDGLNPLHPCYRMDTSSYGISDALPAKAWAPCLSPTGGGLLGVEVWRFLSHSKNPTVSGFSSSAPGSWLSFFHNLLPANCFLQPETRDQRHRPVSAGRQPSKGPLCGAFLLYPVYLSSSSVPKTRTMLQYYL